MRLLFSRIGILAASLVLAACSTKSVDEDSRSVTTTEQSEELNQPDESSEAPDESAEAPDESSETPDESSETSDESSEAQAEDESEEASSKAVAPQPEKHLRVLVSYENGQFQLEKVTEVMAPLRMARGGRTRNGIQYIARGQSSFTGSAPDPRTLHVEVENPLTGKLEHHATSAPGKQYFSLRAPAETDIVEFLDDLRTPGGTLHAASPVLGSIDLRAHR